MEQARLRSVIAGIRDGSLDEQEALEALRALPYADLGFAKIDHHRSLRQSLPEAVYGPGKTVDQCVGIVDEMLANSDAPVIVTRTSEAQRTALVSKHPGALVEGSTVVWRPGPPVETRMSIACAGTGDLPVANECKAVLRAHGVDADLITDCGVAGIHRLFDNIDAIREAEVVIAVAGMEGALASVVGGLVAAPVIAVPTSVGYGSSMEGITALLAMLSSCASGIAVVGIDNGYGAACAALRIANLRSSE